MNHRGFMLPIVHFAGVSGRGSVLALQNRVKEKRLRFKITAFKAPWLHLFPLLVLSVILAFPLKIGRMGALCRACSMWSSVHPGPAAPFQGGHLQPNSPDPSILQGSRKLPTHFSVFLDPQASSAKLLEARAEAERGFSPPCSPPGAGVLLEVRRRPGGAGDTCSAWPGTACNQ